MGRRLILIALCGLICGAATPAAEQPAADDRDDLPVRVYTNADLERLEPPPQEAGGRIEQDEAGWEFVRDFLERQHERLDNERFLAAERRDGMQAQEETRAWHPWWLGYPYRYTYGYPYAPHRRHGRQRRAETAGASPTSPPIFPLHARPTSAERQRSRAIRRSGADAVPNRSRSSDRD